MLFVSNQLLCLLLLYLFIYVHSPNIIHSHKVKQQEHDKRTFKVTQTLNLIRDETQLLFKLYQVIMAGSVANVTATGGRGKIIAHCILCVIFMAILVMFLHRASLWSCLTVSECCGSINICWIQHCVLPFSVSLVIPQDASFIFFLS